MRLSRISTSSVILCSSEFFNGRGWHGRTEEAGHRESMLLHPLCVTVYPIYPDYRKSPDNQLLRLDREIPSAIAWPLASLGVAVSTQDIRLYG